MSEKRNATRPNVDRIMGSLKDFQRNTVEHVTDRFFDSDNSTRRFLVADEVGLGKTMVARGVAAKLVDRLWEDVERIDVIYICSNAAIAAQNVARLKLSEDQEFTPPTRLTLLPRTISSLRKNKLNFVALTPGTSFSRHSATGTGPERALLYVMLREEWELGRRAGPLNVFCHAMGRDHFKTWTDWTEREAVIDEQMRADFLTAVRKTDLRELFEETAEYFQRRQVDTAPPEGKALQYRLIDQLRRVLAHTCVDALEPDLVILDEFQRFKHLLELDEQGQPTSDAGELAHQLFNYEDPTAHEHARTLLLSATPYGAYGFDPDDPGTTHREAFAETVDFLLDDRDESHRLRELFEQQLRTVLSFPTDDAEPDRRYADKIQKLLLQVMCRTERLGATADRNGMLCQVDHEDQRLDPDDVLAYASWQQLARHLDSSDLIEYWKSSPYLLNLMDDYKVSSRLRSAWEEGLPEDLADRLRDGRPGMLDRNTIDEFDRIDPSNPRLRELLREILAAGAERLLWLNPSLTYYEPAGPFAHEGADAFTKRLIFSNWAVVPKAISAVLSYAVEQKLALEGGRDRVSYADQSRTGGPLKALFAEGRVQPAFGLVYPSHELARRIDPYTLTAASQSRLTAAEAISVAARTLEEPIRERLKPWVTDDARVDNAWYWITPILLDYKSDREKTVELLTSQAFREIQATERSEEAPDTRSQWDRCIEWTTAVLNEDVALGRQPDDLAEVTARMALGGFSVTALRALGRIAEPGSATELDNRIAATQVGLALRGLFNLPHASHLIYGLRSFGEDTPDTLWEECLNYAISGNLQATLDEYVHLLPGQLGLVDHSMGSDQLSRVADEMSQAISLRTSRTAANFFDRTNDSPYQTDTDSHRRNLRLRFAVPFAQARDADEAETNRIEQVRSAFNSPFWPFVLASTSVGQEGLDFHLYCHALIHWNLPANPVDLEQREGRIHRYKNHAVRKNLAATFGERLLSATTPPTLNDAPEGTPDPVQPDPWQALFDLGVKTRPPDQTELWPFWIFLPKQLDSDTMIPTSLIERHVMAMPLSRDQLRIEALRKAVVLYRSVMGQPKQEDLMLYMQQTLSEEQFESFTELTRISLMPPLTTHYARASEMPDCPASDR